MKNKNHGGDAKNDAFIRLTLLQAVVCACIFAAVFIFAKVNTESFNAMRESFSSFMTKDFDYSDFLPFGSESKPDENSTSAESTVSDVSSTVSGGASGGEDLINEADIKNTSFEFYEAASVSAMPVNGSVSSDFGYRIHPIYGTRGFHSGVDLACDEGTKIHAALDGKVIAASYGEKSGNYIIIEHADSIETLYAHCSQLFVAQGVYVRKGDVIAAVGSTGVATGPHLHFEVHKDGVKCNPDYLLSAAEYVY